MTPSTRSTTSTVCASCQDMCLAGASDTDDAAFPEYIMSHFTDIEREKLLRIDCTSEGGKQATLFIIETSVDARMQLLQGMRFVYEKALRAEAAGGRQSQRRARPSESWLLSEWGVVPNGDDDATHPV